MLTYVSSKSAAKGIFPLPCSSSHRCFPPHEAKEVSSDKMLCVGFEEVGQRGGEREPPLAVLRGLLFLFGALYFYFLPGNLKAVISENCYLPREPQVQCRPLIDLGR